jgi:hypothetical protein
MNSPTADEPDERDDLEPMPREACESARDRRAAQEDEKRDPDSVRDRRVAIAGVEHGDEADDGGDWRASSA